MTNKEFMCTLNTATFEEVMHTLYFNGKLWIEGNDAKKMSTPTAVDICLWLEKPFDPETEFWKSIIGEIYKVVF